jgi:hypothetical protein
MPLPSEGLSHKFDPSRLYPQPATADADADVRRTAIESSQLDDWEWWIAEWRRTPEGGGA